MQDMFGKTMARIEREAKFEILPEPPAHLARFVSLGQDAPSRQYLSEAFE